MSRLFLHDIGVERNKQPDIEAEIDLMFLVLNTTVYVRSIELHGTSILDTLPNAQCEV
jgi:hypothetical protein